MARLDNTRIEWITCKVCGTSYPRMKIRKRNDVFLRRKYPNIRRNKTVTCSRKCSNEYVSLKVKLER